MEVTFVLNWPVKTRAKVKKCVLGTAPPFYWLSIILILLWEGKWPLCPTHASTTVDQLNKHTHKQCSCIETPYYVTRYIYCKFNSTHFNFGKHSVHRVSSQYDENRILALAWETTVIGLLKIGLYGVYYQENTYLSPDSDDGVWTKGEMCATSVWSLLSHWLYILAHNLFSTKVHIMYVCISVYRLQAHQTTQATIVCILYIICM